MSVKAKKAILTLIGFLAFLFALGCIGGIEQGLSAPLTGFGRAWAGIVIMIAAWCKAGIIRL